MIAPFSMIPTYPSPHSAGFRREAKISLAAGPGIFGMGMVRGINGLGAEPSITQTLTDLSATAAALRPVAEFIGAHPYLSATMLISAIILGGAAGGYIGAGERMVRKKA